MINPQSPYCSIEERLEYEGFHFAESISNRELSSKIQQYLSDGAIKAFRLIPSYIAIEGSDHEDEGSKDSHILYVRYHE